MFFLYSDSAVQTPISRRNKMEIGLIINGYVECHIGCSIELGVDISDLAAGKDQITAELFVEGTELLYTLDGEKVVLGNLRETIRPYTEDPKLKDLLFASVSTSEEGHVAVPIIGVGYESEVAAWQAAMKNFFSQEE